MIIAVASIVAVGLLLRSEKEYLLKTELDYLGNYDGIIYDISENDYQKVKKLENIDKSGCYKEMGLCGTDSETKYKVVSFPDDTSVSLYHMTMKEGNYPEKENEIAIDSGVAKLLGLKPEIGKVFSLNLYDFENNFIEKKDFLITGIFEGSNPETYGGWYRYPDNMEDDKYMMPAVIVSSAYEYRNAGKNVTAYFQHSYENNSEFTDAVLETSKGISQEQIDIPLGRSFAYSYVMGFSDGIYKEYGELNPWTALQALKDGKGIKDFYSSILIPVFVMLVCIISALSIYNAVRLNLRDRINNLSILRCIGMSSFTTFWLLFIEIIVFVLIACVLGYGFGSLLHMLMLYILKNGWNIALTPGFTVSAYVKAVTFNPYVISGLTVVVFTVFASLIPMIRLAVKTPVAIKHTNTKYKRKTKCIMSGKKTWVRLLSERVPFFSLSIFLMYVFILGVIPFGYTYFHAVSDKQNSEYKYELEDSDLGHYDYAAYKSTLRNMSQFNVESRHYDGINEDAVNNLVLSDNYDEVFAISDKYSTKLSVKKDDENEDIHNLLGRTALRGQAVSNLTQEDREKSEEYYNSCLEAEAEMIRKTGYSDDENVYAVPTVGLTYDGLSELESCVVDGNIDYEKIKNGEEVIIAVYEDDIDTALNVFKVGEYLPLSDVKLNDEEDHFDFYHLFEHCINSQKKEYPFL